MVYVILRSKFNIVSWGKVSFFNRYTNVKAVAARFVGDPKTEMWKAFIDVSFFLSSHSMLYLNLHVFLYM